MGAHVCTFRAHVRAGALRGYKHLLCEFDHFLQVAIAIAKSCSGVGPQAFCHGGQLQSLF